jgi:hypothetical protein
MAGPGWTSENLVQPLPGCQVNSYDECLPQQIHIPTPQTAVNLRTTESAVGGWRRGCEAIAEVPSSGRESPMTLNGNKSMP